MTLEFISVICANYNKEDFVAAAVQSAVDQTWPASNMEVVIVDDCSTDSSWGRIRSAFGRITEEKVVSDIDVVLGDINGVAAKALRLPANSRQAFARNQAMKVADQRATHYAILDSDDLFAPTKLEQCMVEFAKNGNTGLVCHDFHAYNTGTGCRNRCYMPAFNRDRLLRENTVFSNAVVSRKAVDDCGALDPEMVPLEDWEMWIRITEKYTCVHIPESLGQYTVDKAGAMAGLPADRHLELYRLAITKMNNRFGQKKV